MIIMHLDPHAIWALGLTVVALILFTRERIPLETSSLTVIVLLAVSFQIYPYQNSAGQTLSPVVFFSGFAHEALIAVCGLMVAGYGIVRTGALQPYSVGANNIDCFSPAKRGSQQYSYRRITIADHAQCRHQNQK